MIISMHLPKTAGTSFRLALEEHFGERLLLDYADRPLGQSQEEAEAAATAAAQQSAEMNFAGVDCIHGHFLATKYASRPDVTFVTWLREPVDRLQSHYMYWRQTPTADNIAPLRRRMLDEDWSFSDFAFQSRLQNFYSQFLAGVPLDAFRFVGITEHYAEDLAEFGASVLGAEIPVRHLNASDTPADSLAPALRAELEEFHSIDVALYRQALANREQRLDQQP